MESVKSLSKKKISNSSSCAQLSKIKQENVAPTEFESEIENAQEQMNSDFNLNVDIEREHYESIFRSQKIEIQQLREKLKKNKMKMKKKRSKNKNTFGIGFERSAIPMMFLSLTSGEILSWNDSFKEKFNTAQNRIKMGQTIFDIFTEFDPKELSKLSDSPVGVGANLAMRFNGKLVVLHVQQIENSECLCFVLM
jgi:hypothetical protein